MDRKQLFAMLDGTPSHALIAVGLALALLSPLVLNFKAAALASALAEQDRVKTLKELDLEEFKRQQDEERKNSPEEIRYKQAVEQRKSATVNASLPVGLSLNLNVAQQNEADANEKEMQEIRRAAEEKEKKRKEALEKKQEQLDKTYDAIGPRRAVVEAQTSVAGTRSHLVIGWLGRLLLLLGLLVMTVQSEGVRQKVILIVLLVVMFSALSGVNLGFQAQGHLGEERIESSVAPRPK